MRMIVGFVCLVAMVGCGGSSGGSYTSRAMSEFRAGNGADHAESRKRPSAKEVAAIQKRVKSVDAGSKNDFYQAFWILSNQREHETFHFETLATSRFVRDAYKRVFGSPDALNTSVVPNSWSHRCTDGVISVRGVWKTKDQPAYMSTYPIKQGSKKTS